MVCFLNLQIQSPLTKPSKKCIVYLVNIVFKLNNIISLMSLVFLIKLLRWKLSARKHQKRFSGAAITIAFVLYLLTALLAY